MAKKYNGGNGHSSSDNANLSQNVIVKNYPANSYSGEDKDLGDSCEGIDSQIKADVNGAQKHRAKRKY